MRISRYQEKLLRNNKPKAGEGKGRYIYENISRGTLDLPGKTGSLKYDSKTRKGEQFEGSDYYMQFVPSELRLVQVIHPTENNVLQEQNQMSNDKLITEQPPKFEPQGKVEFVMPSQSAKPLHESPQPSQNPDVLLNEEPEIDGIEII